MTWPAASAAGLGGLPHDELWANRANAARISNWALGGRDNYEADRAVGTQLRAAAPWFEASVKITRAYSHLTVRALAKRQIRHFLNLGCGLPLLNRTDPDIHTVASESIPHATILHVDHDPMVGGHARMCMAGPPGNHPYLHADLRQITGILQQPDVQSLKAGGEPVGVLLHDVLPYLTDTAEVDHILGTLRDWLPLGSAISLTHATADLRPEQATAAARIIEQAGIPYRPRTHGQIRDLLSPWQLLSPGLVPTGRCHPAHKHTLLPKHHSGAYAAIAIHPVNRYPEQVSSSPKDTP
ncbi:SAM-dependent methyltransferase [Streptomyces sp. NBC_01433]|uniref:SAM-dependent methyltransferase n=1 Tax=Streptomyces sp. NBC_01433 TaxID=2903864 RepID=UPI0022552B8B|nr:SAM-dependent methyltransferase [Streptomyces sp. NBC_01433]MCX4681493.1 SAM-dependent methyltransferase [Streptomyces sp. NBC_01433]